ncbi:MAG: universal stress protein [Nitrosopumilaceae archaeon]|nr:universal stress protein [Nitrosopumilaceae archaeon]NIU00327.1 universal stress protein [Nitrosopumilaceae archaeon]NIU86729.1 universal stress protein [Nitrosopumilaceae archaeon]NIV65430.1 universal stress protein [Nitrosopumilaceae archaeon]NIX60929.1 universal stress protein [Nitrosopumilaceae archaeon]
MDYLVKKILLPFDGSSHSKRGLEKAIYFARQCQATITGLYVAYVPPKLVFEAVENIDSATMKNINKFLEDAKTLAAQNGIDFEHEVVHGNIGDKVLEFSNEWEYDLIVIGSKGAGSTNSYLGSVANYILERSNVPVIVVK